VPYLKAGLADLKPDLISIQEAVRTSDYDYDYEIEQRVTTRITSASQLAELTAPDSFGPRCLSNT
jgi:hypothetical protein